MSMTRIPVYQNPLLAPRGINPGRTWLESYNQPITVGHVLVMPGDIIVADGDGVAVVPRPEPKRSLESRAGSSKTTNGNAARSTTLLKSLATGRSKVTTSNYRPAASRSSNQRQRSPALEATGPLSRRCWLNSSSYTDGQRQAARLFSRPGNSRRGPREVLF